MRGSRRSKQKEQNPGTRGHMADGGLGTLQMWTSSRSVSGTCHFDGARAECRPEIPREPSEELAGYGG